MEHFITDIKINKLRHLENIDIELSKDKKKHLLITGKNGVGKTTLLGEIRDYLKSIESSSLGERVYWHQQLDRNKKLLKDEIRSEERKVEIESDITSLLSLMSMYGEGIDIKFSFCEDLDMLYKQGKFILAYYSDNRNTNVEVPNGVESIKLKQSYTMEDKPSMVFIKYLVDLKTQQSFARNEGDTEVVENIEHWFYRLENALKLVLDNESIKLKFDYKNYNFKIEEEGRKPYGFNELSAGYSSLISIVSDLILRMDKNRASVERNYGFDTEGIVMIDELETHLHIELQKKVLPFLTEFFPNIQFIVTTHSPFVLNSIDNSVVYDLEKNIRVENLSYYSYDGIVEGYFNVENYSCELKRKVHRYRELALRNNLSDDERAERSQLRVELKNASNDLVPELICEYNDIEQKRKDIND